MKTTTHTDNLWSRKFNLKLIILSLAFLQGSFSYAQFSVTTNSGSGLAATYTSLANAITALNAATISAPVVITCPTGTETSPSGGYSITAQGTATNTITIQGNGAANSVITAPSPAGTAGSLNDAIFKLVGADYVTIQGFKMQENASNTTTTTASNNMVEWGVALLYASTTNGAQNNTIQNNTITLNRTYLNTFGVYSNTRHSATTVTTAAEVTSSAGANSFNKVYGNTINNVNYGIVFIGAGTTIAAIDNGNDIGGSSASTGNTITNWGGGAAATAYTSLTGNNYCIFDNQQINENISYNTITSASLATAVTEGGILKNYSVASPTTGTITCTINNNTVTVTNNPSAATTGAVIGINSQGLTPLLSTATFSMNNNTVQNCVLGGSTSTTNGLTCMTNLSLPGTLNITGNTILNNAITATSATSGVLNGISNTGAAGTVNLNSNVIRSFASTAASGQTQGITNSGAVVTALNINSNSLGNSTSGFFSTSTASSGTLFGISTSAGAATCALTIQSNDIRGITYNTAASATQTYITNSAATLSQNISSNTFTNLNVNTTGNATFISNSVTVPANGSQTISSNSIVTAFNKGGAGGTVTCMTSSASTILSTVTVTHTNNNFSNITVTGATTLNGIANTDGTGSIACARTVTGNTFSNWTGGTSAITVISYGYWGGSAPTLSTNTITSITGQSSITAINLGSSGNTATLVAVGGNTINNITSTGTGGAVIGIACANTSTAININGNTINTLSCTGAFGVTAISVTGAATTIGIFKNKIYDISGSNASTIVTGITVSASGTTLNLYNNLIGDLRATAATVTSPASAIIGINLTSTSTSSTLNVYYNTINIAASSTGTNFATTGIFHTTSTTATTAALNLRNNIIVNTSTAAGTGLTVAYRRSGGAASNLANYVSTSNNNLFYAGTPSATNLIYNDGTSSAQTLAAYKGGVFTAGTIASRDAASISENPTWQSTTGSSANFLKFSTSVATGIESGAVNISTYTDDYTGTIRFGNSGTTSTGTAPDMGAWELNGTPLPLCAGTPATSTISAVSSAVCTGNGTTLSLSAAYTDIGISFQWKSSTVSGGPYSTILGTSSTQATGNLTATTYYVCVISCSYSGLSYTTAEKAITVTTPLAGIAVTGSATICSGASVTLTENAGNATSWSWSNGGATTQAITVSPTISTTYTVTATLNGCSATANQTITVNPTPTAVTISPSSASICGGGTQALVASGGTITVPGTSTLGAGTSSSTASTTGSTLGPNPMETYYGGSKQQMLVLASELTTLGLSAGSNINSIAFNMSAVESRTLQNYVVKMQHTSTSAFSSTTFVTTGFTTVRNAANLIPVTGWDTIAFNNNFTWNGTSNILIEINFTNVDGGGSGTNTAVYSTTTFASTLFYRADNITAANMDAATTANFSYSQRNNIQFGYSNTTPGSFTWTPTSTLNTATGANVIASPIDPSTTYTATSTINGCSNSNTVTITLSDGAAITTDPVASAKCAGQTATFTVAATGQSLTYQWRKGGNDITGNASATTATLTLTNVSAADIDSYDVVVTATCGAPVTSAAVALTVTTPLAGINASATALCTGNLGSVTLTENGGNATSWSWSNSATTQAITVSPTVTTTYTVTVMLNGCSATANQTITVSPTPTAVSITPSSASICAGGTQVLVASGGTVTLPVIATLGTGTTSSAASATNSTLGPNPMESYYGGSKQQMIVLASELTTLGLSTGSSINSIAFNMSAVESRTLLNYVVKLQHTSTSAFSSTTFVTTGFTTVRNAANLTPVTGWNTITFDNNFTWNGTSNLLIEVNFTNNDGGGSGSNTALYSTTAFASTLFYRTDNSTTVDAATTASFSAYSLRNNMQFGYLSTTPASFAWNPSSTLSASTGASVTASPTSQITYTATSTIGGCSSSNTVTVGISTGAAITTDPVASAKCAGQTATFTVAATGQSLTYQWRKGGNNITGNASATTATLTLTNVSATDNANYDVVVTAACGSPVTSAAAGLLVTTPLAGISATATTICSGTSTTLTENGGNATSWSWSNSATTQAIIVSPTTTTSYTVTITVNGCSTTATQSITVNPAPAAATATATVSSVCAGVAFGLSSTPSTISSTILTEGFETGATGWAFQDSSSTGSAVSGQIWHIQAAPYNDASGSITFSNFSATGSNFAYANADAGGSGSQTRTFMTSPAFSTVGYTGSATLTFKNLYKYYSSSSPVEQVKVQISIDGGTTFTDLVDYSGTSVGTTTSNAEVVTTSTVTIPSTYMGKSNVKLRWRYLSNWGYVWIVDDVLLTGTPLAYTYSWASTPSGYSSTTQNPTGITQTAATAYTVTVSLGSCSTTATANVGLTTASVAPTGATGTTAICNGGSTTLTVNGGTVGTGAVVEWFTGSCGGTSAGTGNSITVSPTSTTTYYVRYNGTCNTTTCATVTVTVNQLSVAPTGATGTTTICNGGSTTLTVSGGTVGTGAVAEWFTGSCGGTSAGTGNSITVSPTSTSTYYVRYNGTCNTTTCATVIVTVRQPSAPSNVTVSICPGSNYVFNGTTYNTAGTHTATFANAAGCDSTVTLNITVQSPVTPTITIATASTTVCSGSNVSFTASGTNGGPSPVYQWQRNGSNAGTGTSITFLSGTLGNGDVIQCILTANNPCQTTATANSNTIQLTVNTSPTVGTSTLASPSLCTIGATTAAYNSNTNGGGTWTTSNPSVATIATTNGASGDVTATGVGTAILTYTKTLTNGCVSGASTIVTVAPIATPNAITATSNSICKGATTILSNTTTGGTWSTASSSIASVNASGVVTGISAGVSTIVYTASNASGCKASANYNVTVNPIPTVPTMGYVAGTPNPQTGTGGAFCVGKTFKVVGASTLAPVVANLTGVWSSSDTTLVSATAAGSGNNKDTALIVIKAAGTGVALTYKVTSPAGCINSRVTTFNTSTTCPFNRGAIKEELMANSVQFTMYPNPARSTVSLQVEKLVGSGTIVVTDLYGKQVKTQALSMGTNTIDVSNLAKGFYLVSTITEQGKTTKKLVVE